jgi:flavin-binding protein dodecin
MLRMIEIVGTSAEGYSEAVRSAVEEMIQKGEKVHFFQIMEQRGAVREGQLKEFQVVLKVAVEA